MKYICLILILTLIFIILHYKFPYLYTIFNLPTRNIDFPVDMIIAHYKEDLEWVDKLPSNYNIYIYTKSNYRPNIKRKYKHKYLPNIGRCDHTYLYHIINNFNNLAEQNIFCSGSTKDLIDKNFLLKSIIKNIGKYPFYTLNLEKIFNKNLNNFQITEHCSSHKNNKHKNCKLIESRFKNLGNYEKININKGNIKYTNYKSIFSVSRKNIQQNNMKIYEKLLNTLIDGDNEENGHYMERLWAHLLI